MASRAARKRLRELPTESSSRIFERPSIPKRPRHTNRSPFLPQAPKPAPALQSTKTAQPPSLTLSPPPADEHGFLFTFTGALRHELDELQKQTPPPLNGSAHAAGPAAHTVAEELEDVLLNHPHSGKGQNEMMQDWFTECGTHYLKRMMEAESAQSDNRSCDSCQQTSDIFDCSDCLHQQLLCGSCVSRAHRTLPSHRFRKWNGSFFEPVSSYAAGYKFHLGHGGAPCDYGRDRKFTLGDTNGLQELVVRFCRHPGRGDAAHQLLTARIYPCSDQRPESGFTFNVLRDFHLMATEAKVSTQRYYNVLVRHSNNAFPQRVDDCYREFYRVARQWDHLQDLRRAGCFTVATGPSTRGDLALRCPACPRLDFNYTAADIDEAIRYVYSQHVTYDGSFQMNRKKKPFDKWDTCLSEGRKFMVFRDEFLAHLAHADKDGGKFSNKNAACNNHKAIDATLVRIIGLAETGIGSPLCARHSFYLPISTVSFIIGERFSFTDFAIASAFRLFLGEGTRDLGLHYDIMCHYETNLWKRLNAVHAPVGPVQRVDLSEFAAAVPKFHLAGHTESCQARYSLNNLPGAGRLDGEGGERCWANLNHSAGSTSEKGPGSRLDSINHVMQQWNWCKTTGMVEYLLDKLKDAVKMSREQLEAFQDLHKTMVIDNKDLVAGWETLSTEPELRNGKWISVFMMKESPGVSLAATLKHLSEQEIRDQALGNGAPAVVGMSGWVGDGIELETLQKRLKDDIKTWGKDPTPRQSLECATRRKTLVTRLDSHCESGHKYVPPVTLEPLTKASLEDQGKPERLSTTLPSRLPQASLEGDGFSRVKECERQLRRVSCLKALQTVRAIAVQKAHLLRGKEQHIRGIVVTTRAEGAITRLATRITQARWLYTDSRKQLLHLCGNEQDIRTFRELKDSDMSGLTAALRGKDKLGDGHTKLPWYWRVSMSEGKDDAEEITSSGAAVREEYEDSIRVEWFRARERSRRWNEEVNWLQREVATVVLDFQARSGEWGTRKGAATTPGIKAYCARQAALWAEFRDDARKRCNAALISSAGTCALARRVLQDWPAATAAPKSSVDLDKALLVSKTIVEQL